MESPPKPAIFQMLLESIFLATLLVSTGAGDIASHLSHEL